MSMTVLKISPAAANVAVLEHAKEGNQLLKNTEKVMLECVQAQLACAQAKQAKRTVLRDTNEEAERIIQALQILLNNG